MVNSEFNLNNVSDISVWRGSDRLYYIDVTIRYNLQNYKLTYKKNGYAAWTIAEGSEGQYEKLMINIAWNSDISYKNLEADMTDAVIGTAIENHIRQYIG